MIYLLILAFTISYSTESCKSIAKATVKHWTKKQVKSFKKNCVEKVSKQFDPDKSKQFCDCATGILSEKYPDASKAESLNVLQLLADAAQCVKKN